MELDTHPPKGDILPGPFWGTRGVPMNLILSKRTPLTQNYKGRCVSNWVPFSRWFLVLVCQFSRQTGFLLAMLSTF